MTDENARGQPPPPPYFPPAVPPAPQPPWYRRPKTWVLTAVGVLLFWWLVTPGDEPQLAATETSVSAELTPTPTPHPTPRPNSTPTPIPTPTPTSTPTPTPIPTEEPDPTPTPTSGMFELAQVVDGDTIDVLGSDGGERVRIIGIDTPEQGECGYAEAADVLADLIGDQPITLVEGAQDDRDRYGRLLRYVDVGDTDVGLVLIERGLAIARYDSRDGYGAHPREEKYAADAGSTNACGAQAAPAPEAVPATAPESAAGCDPSYPDVCIPPAPPDLDCGQIAERQFAVVGADPHGFDGNSDGVGCES